MRGLAYRIVLTCINILFPPLSVMLLCGADWDCILNCVLFLCAIIPSHVHGFYISCTYFHRRRKVRKGRYPGGPKTLIHSKNVINGGASDAEVERLWRKENGMPVSRRSSRRTSSANGRPQQLDGKKAEMVQRQGSNNLGRMPTRMSGNAMGGHDLGRMPTNKSGLSNPTSGNGGEYGAHVARDGYGPVLRIPSRAAQAQDTGHSPLTPVSPMSTRSSRTRQRW